MNFTPLVPRLESYEACYQAFQWQIPERFNIATAVCDRHAANTPDATALIDVKDDNTVLHWTFKQLQAHANRLANVLLSQGIKRGDRIGILVPQSIECLLTHIAAYKLGAIALPLSELFGPEGLAHRVRNSSAKALVATPRGYQNIAEVRDELPALEVLICTADKPSTQGQLFWPLLEQASDQFTSVDTRAEEAAILIYTSGTTGQAKGALHAHRTLLGHLPGIEMAFEFFPQQGDLFWTPSDWSWVAGLLDVLMPALYHGIPVLAHRFAKFDPEAAYDLMATYQVRNALIPPTALKIMRQLPKQQGLNLRSICSGGESLGADLIDWGREALNVTINEGYGQTECNLVLAQNAALMPCKPGSMGRPVPGHEVVVINPEGEIVPTGEEGIVAAQRPDPVMFLDYWNNPEATAAKFINDWCVTGDLAHRDEDGYFWFHGREDDLINSAGYRIGPVEIEACLLKHPAVNLVGVVGKPDAARGEIIKAFIVPADDYNISAELITDIQNFVRTRLAAHEYPREIAFLDEMPLTVSGKIRRVDLRKLG